MTRVLLVEKYVQSALSTVLKVRTRRPAALTALHSQLYLATLVDTQPETADIPVALANPTPVLSVSVPDR